MRLIADFDTVLSIGLIGAARKAQSADEGASDPRIDALVTARSDAKKAKNWAEADRIRDDLKAEGIILTDTPEGTKWTKA
ncbi:MAG: hypothetical protein EOM14_10895 [Clostridia bacterium]|nr:hypothetical protein [Clostridia bacterium]